MDIQQSIRTLFRFRFRLKSSGTATGAALSRLVLLATSTLIVVAVMGCKGFFIGPTVTTITITPSSPSVNVGQTTQLTATATYDNGSTGNVSSTASWSSSDSTTATVSATGLVKGIAEGSPTITAALDGISGTATLTVNAAGSARTYAKTR